MVTAEIWNSILTWAYRVQNLSLLHLLAMIQIFFSGNKEKLTVMIACRTYSKYSICAHAVDTVI